MSKDGTPEGMELEVTTYPDGSQMATFVPKKGAKPKDEPKKDAVEEPSEN